jgi:hypothetical protein
MNEPEKDNVAELVVDSPINVILPIAGGVLIFLLIFIAIVVA